jgi:hypothetical protein
MRRELIMDASGPSSSTALTRPAGRAARRPPIESLYIETHLPTLVLRSSSHHQQQAQPLQSTVCLPLQAQAGRAGLSFIL